MNCPRPCRYLNYEAHQNFIVKQTDLKLDRNYLKLPSNFYGNLLSLTFMSGFVTMTKEELFYDGYALLGETGGSLGLFLGLSLLGLSKTAYGWISKKLTHK